MATRTHPRRWLRGGPTSGPPVPGPPPAFAGEAGGAGAALEATRALGARLLLGVEDPPPPAPSPTLLAVHGPAAGERFTVRDGSILGRGRRSDLRIDDPLASRRHVGFRIDGDTLQLTDLASKNGLRVNGHRLARVQATLRPGDALAVGESVLVYERAPAGALAPGSLGDTPPTRLPDPRPRPPLPDPEPAGPQSPKSTGPSGPMPDSRSQGSPGPAEGRALPRPRVGSRLLSGALLLLAALLALAAR